MKILVVGGAGYIGSCFVDYVLNNSNHEVVILDDLSTGYKQAIHPKATFYEGSVLDMKILNEIFKAHQIDCVFHFAAKLIVPESVKEPIKYWINNVGGMSVLLEAMRNNQVKNIIFSSTAAVYGNPKTIPVDELSSLDPINPYGSSKLACETMIKECHKAYGINYVILRYFNVAGALDNNEYGLRNINPTLLIPAINKSIIENITVKVFGNDYATKDGSCIRDYIHIEDLVRAHLLAYDYLTTYKMSNTFNLGTSNGYSVLDVVNAVPQAILKNVRYEIADRRLGDPAILLTDNTKAKEMLKWQPQKSLNEMIKSDYEFRLKLYEPKQ